MPSHRGFEYAVDRAKDSSGSYTYEFHLRVEGFGRVMTASELERRGARSPEEGGDNWTTQLEVYAIAFIDGVEAEANGDGS